MSSFTAKTVRLIPKFDPRLIAELKGQKRDITIGLVGVTVSALLTGCGFELINRAVNELRDSATVNLPRLGVICLLTLALFCARYFFTRLQTLYLSRAGTKLTNNLRRRLVRKMIRLPISYFNSRRTGTLQSVLTNDVNIFQNSIGVLRDSIEGPARIIVAVGVIIHLQPLLALAAMPVLGIVVYLVDRNNKKLKVAQGKVQNSLARGTAFSQELLSGIRVIKSFSAQKKIEGIYEEALGENLDDQIGAIRLIAKLRPMVELLGAALIAGLFYVSGVLVERHALMIGAIVAMMAALDSINQGAKMYTNANNAYAQIEAAADRIFGDVLDQPDETLATGSQTIALPKGRIEFKNVSFTYADGTVALNNVSFVIEPRESLALVGPSGAGKSTIADLILRFYEPTEGQIFFDGIDYKELDIHWLRSQFGVVPQQSFLFAGSIAENLKLGNSNATAEEMCAAMDQANVTPFVESSPYGIETMLGERGTRLSGGEMQRLSIARALLLQPRVLVLDEATSNLDAHSEKVVTDALNKAMVNRTTLLIAHRLTTAARATTIVMLRKGEVIERGSHTDLMTADGAYATMYRAFMQGALGDEIS